MRRFVSSFTVFIQTPTTNIRFFILQGCFFKRKTKFFVDIFLRYNLGVEVSTVWNLSLCRCRDFLHMIYGTPVETDGLHVETLQNCRDSRKNWRDWKIMSKPRFYSVVAVLVRTCLDCRDLYAYNKSFCASHALKR
jgi:hypothetical protein